MKSGKLILLAFLGIFILLLISKIISPETVSSKEIKDSSSYVKLSGKIVSEKSYDDFKIISLKDNYGTIQVSCFSCPKLINKSVIIEGKIEEYKNKRQLTAEKIIENAP